MPGTVVVVVRKYGQALRLSLGVEREDATFTVDRVAEYPKKELPALEVYKNLDYEGLRLITCGGDFDADWHYYPSNVVVFASMTGVA